MSAVLATLATLLHAALMIAAAPVLVGLVRLVKARLLGRRGPPLLQPYRDLSRLLRKQPVVAENASWLFRAAPTASFAAMLTAILLIPSFARGMITAPLADTIVLAGLLTVARATMALAAMDVGTAFGGIGASRAMTFSTYAEPALILVIFALALLAGSTNLDVIVATLRAGTNGPQVSPGLAAIPLVILAVAGNGRIPVDDPATLPELTMVHEAMALEYSGRHLALIEWAAALRLLLWATLIGTIVFPFGIGDADRAPLLWIVGAVAWGAKTALLGVVLAAFETSFAKMRVFHVPELLGVAVVLGLLAVIFLFVSQGLA